MFEVETDHLRPYTVEGQKSHHVRQRWRVFEFLAHVQLVINMQNPES